MQKGYRHWFTEHKTLNSFETPYSGTRGTLNDAKNWAVQLFWTHPEVNSIKFKADDGRKTYTINRGDFPCFFDHKVIHAPDYKIVTNESDLFVVVCQ